MAAEQRFRKARDEEIVAAITKVLLREGTLSSQRQLHRFVSEALRERDAAIGVTAERVRHLALRSGVVTVQLRTRRAGRTPDLHACPVCASKLKRAASKTLHGATVLVGYKCPRCPWWTGREYRVPRHYTFVASVERAPGGQVTFRDNGALSTSRAPARRPRAGR